MYKSPIKIFTDEMKYYYDDEIVNAIQKYDIVIDKEELIKALQYDREQYEKGYADGKRAANDELVRCKDCFYAEEMEGIIGGTCLYCTHWCKDVDGDTFCSNGFSTTNKESKQ